MDEAQIVLLIVQIVILIIQCTSEIRERQRMRSSLKGIFQIGYNNIGGNQFSEDSVPKWTYDFNRYLSFKNIGDDAVTLLRYEVIADEKLEASLGKGTMFSNKEEFSILYIPLNNKYDKEELEIIFKLFLKNPS